MAEDTPRQLTQQEVAIAAETLEVGKTEELISALTTQQKLSLIACYASLAKARLTSQSIRTMLKPVVAWDASWMTSTCARGSTRHSATSHPSSSKKTGYAAGSATTLPTIPLTIAEIVSSSWGALHGVPKATFGVDTPPGRQLRHW